VRQRNLRFAHWHLFKIMLGTWNPGFLTSVGVEFFPHSDSQVLRVWVDFLFLGLKVGGHS
jgi:hypothetical protein